MGTEIERDRFDEADHARFAARLTENLEALAQLLARPRFGEGPAMIGAELEMSLVDRAGRPLMINQSLLAEMGDPRFTVELNRFNIECNSSPTLLAGSPFSALQDELSGALELVDDALGSRGRPAIVGILPTLAAVDLEAGAMTDIPRYRALAEGLLRHRSQPFRIAISGADPLEVHSNAVTLEGANTSLQVHLKVDPRRYADVYDAAQMATAPALAMACNAPSFLGHLLWEETRVVLFKQAVDDRRTRDRAEHPVARVAFGTGWLHGQGALDLFREGVALHQPLLPVCGEEDSLSTVRAGGVPALAELRLHNGTVWRWNRPVYDPADGGHLRIELRALPAGPTLVDMMADAAFLLGLTFALADGDPYRDVTPFDSAHSNFYRAAQFGLDAELAWPLGGGRLSLLSARELVTELLPRARSGLLSAGVDVAEVERLIGVIEARLAAGVTGARWQRQRIMALEPRLGRRGALNQMFAEYLEHSAAGQPVHTWPNGS